MCDASYEIHSLSISSTISQPWPKITILVILPSCLFIDLQIYSIKYFELNLLSYC